MADPAEYQLIALVLLFQFNKQLIVDLVIVFEMVGIPEVNGKIEHQKDLTAAENVIVDINLQTRSHVNIGYQMARHFKVSTITLLQDKVTVSLHFKFDIKMPLFLKVLNKCLQMST